MKTVSVLACLVWVLMASVAVSAQQTLGPWTIYSPNGRFVFVSDDCRIELNDEKKYLAIQTQIKHPVEGPESYIVERLIISLAAAEPRLILQESWYDKQRNSPEAKLIERNSYSYDQSTRRATGRAEPYLFKKLKEMDLLPKELKAMIPDLPKNADK
ncbi:MAG TPA: hypothetical protein VHQ41_02020 [Patescibacteria group bacterium]|jgi:hypothetical protein|nr:hypothetical protein [Patescibacteria group bacterium]